MDDKKVTATYEPMQKNVAANEEIKPIRVVLPIIVVSVILAILLIYTYIQKQIIVRDSEYVINQMAEYIAGNISNEIDYAKSSIKLSTVSVAQSMTSEKLDNPSEVILPMVGNTPFGGIEYIRSDGMNVMNIGEPFDASDRVYYIEGIKGNTGVWNNYHPKTSKETLMNFYTPLIYDGEVTGVITGYIEATTQIAPLFETRLYGEPIHGLLVDENDMVICSTVQSEYIKDLTLEMFMDRFNVLPFQKDRISETIDNATEAATVYKDPNGEGRMCVVAIPETNWKVIIIVPDSSINAIINDNAMSSIAAIAVVVLVIVSYAAFVLLSNVKRRREIAEANLKLEEENRKYDEENHRAFNEIAEIRDIIASANMGTWRIEIVDGQEPRMYVDDTMKELLGTTGWNRTPEETYTDWFDNITEEALDSVLKSVGRMEQGYFDENTYLWKHPTKGIRYVRCGGTAQQIEGGYSLRGYHYDVDDVVREDQAKVAMLKDALDEKNEYYATLGSLGDIFYSMHVLNLTDDTATEFNANAKVREVVNHRHGAIEMMVQVMSELTADEYRERALEFTDLTTLADRMKNKKIISCQLIGKNTGWFLASFITMEKDDAGKPTKVIYTTRVIDEEKRHEEKLIKKSQTDELTGLLNRRAYEEDIYEHNDAPDADEFTYVSLDVNGLKIINDTKGHMAGDELIIGACQCMKKSLGSYGKLYRIGGDEFVAILFCNAQKVKAILEDFDEIIANWKGKLIDGLSISYGWISWDEGATLSVRQLGAIAEKRMYDSKAEHYKKMGVDRRGQQDAHKALCNLYTKILKINVTDDSYQIINMDTSEQTLDKGFSDKISEWLASFGTIGQVHPDDLDEYLSKTNLEYMKQYFAGNKTSLHIFYRRKYEDTYKQVMMEIIPANDYSDANQSLFLYVKDIDK